MGLSDAVFQTLDQKISRWGTEIDKFIDEKVQNIAMYAQQGMHEISSILMKKILVTPYMTENETVVQLWEISKVVSFSLIGIFIVYEAFRKTMKVRNEISTVDFQDIIVRAVQGIILATFSLVIIDYTIEFCNTLVAVLQNYFNMDITPSIILKANTPAQAFLLIALLIVQLYLTIRLIIAYWMRQAELWVFTVFAPVVYVAWINPRWGSYLGSWFKRLFTTAFTQVVHAVIMVLFTGLIGTRDITTIDGACGAIACLIFMLKTPEFLRYFMNAQDNPLAIMRNMTSSNKQQMKKAIRTANFFKDKLFTKKSPTGGNI